MAGIGWVGWEEQNQSLELLVEARGLPGGKSQEPQRGGLDTGSRRSIKVGSQHWWSLRIPGGPRGGSWGALVSQGC